MVEHTAGGRVVARSNRVAPTMKKILIEVQEEIKRLRRKGKSHKDIAKLLHIGSGTAVFYSRGIGLAAKQHRHLLERSYKRGLGRLTKEERHRASLRGGINNRKNLTAKYSKEQLLEMLRDFYTQNRRLPTKRDFIPTYRAFLRIFHTWNKAIQEAGFSPNPVLFAKKHIANDGHKCDSLAEKIIDDWFTARNIAHEHHVPYFNTRFTADFKVGERFIEFFGLHGQLKRYDFLMKKKMKIIQEHNLKLISIYPKDIFPQSQLNIVLKDLL